MHFYKEKFDNVLKHIQFNLDEKLDLNKLAEIACVSKFHFHRLFKAYMGETLGSYIKRLKIETGAKLLRYSDQSVTEIAYKIGYETPTSFNKSFKKVFKISPSEFRKSKNTTFESVKHLKTKSNFNLEISTEIINDILILTNQSKGAISVDERMNLWKDLMKFATRKKLVNKNMRLYGITWDDPSITAIENIRYDACISILNSLESRFTVKQIPQGKYLCFMYQGDYKYMGDVYDQIFIDYILNNKISLRETPLFEEYLNDFRVTKPQDLLTKIYVPIK